MGTPRPLAFLAWEGILGVTVASLGSSLEMRFSSSSGPEPVIYILLRLNIRDVCFLDRRNSVMSN